MAMLQRSVAKHHVRPGQNETESARARSAMRIVDTACQQLHFSAGNFGHGDEKKPPSMTLEASAVFLHETASILLRIGEHGGPHTVYHLIQLLELLVEADPAAVFDLITSAILRGGQQSGYQFEGLAADLIVRLVGRYLADHGAFSSSNRRTVARRVSASIGFSTCFLAITDRNVCALAVKAPPVIKTIFIA